MFGVSEPRISPPHEAPGRAGFDPPGVPPAMDRNGLRRQNAAESVATTRASHWNRATLPQPDTSVSQYLRSTVYLSRKVFETPAFQ